MTGYRSIAAAVVHEIDPILRSRFIANAMPVVDSSQADDLVAEVRATATDASHHCWAYRLPPTGLIYRISDDGEPRGSAGAPILKRIEGADLVGVLVVVARWFGGTKLGVGGLMRAYGGAAAAVLAMATPVDVVPMQRFTIHYPYAAEGRVKALLASEGAVPTAQAYGENIEATFHLPVPDARRFIERLADATAGVAQVVPELGSE